MSASTSGRPLDYGASASSSFPAAGSSSKVKGKQRAIDVDDDNNVDGGEGDRDADKARPNGTTPRRASNGGVSVCVRFTDGTTEDLVDLFVNDKETVREVKRRIRLLRSSLSTNRLRCIYAGRVLSDGTRLAPWISSILRRQRAQESSSRNSIAGIDFSAFEGVVKNAVNSLDDNDGDADLEKGLISGNAKRKDKGKGKEVDRGEQGISSESSATKIWLHCSVGEPGSIEEEAPEAALGHTADKTQPPPAPLPLTGFDRLREAGFSEEEISNIRQQFHEDGPADTAVAGDEDEHARALEEQWMEGLSSGGVDASGSSSGMYTTLFKGIIAGFFFPFLPLFFFRAETNIFSKRMQMAIVAGLSINVLYGGLRAFA